jgi:hypothetical protein
MQRIEQPNKLEFGFEHQSAWHSSALMARAEEMIEYTSPAGGL